jgi:hypothetical protein
MDAGGMYVNSELMVIFELPITDFPTTDDRPPAVAREHSRLG